MCRTNSVPRRSTKITQNILILPGDGIGPEVMRQATRVLQTIRDRGALDLQFEEGLVGGAAIDATGQPLPAETLAAAQAADAILLGAVGGARWNHLALSKRPEQGLLGLRSGLGLFANLRPARQYPQLASTSPLKPEIASGFDVLILRELIGGVYFGQPRGIEGEGAARYGFNNYIYSVAEIERIAHLGFALAASRQQHLCSVDKANVLEVTALWREVVTEIGASHPGIELTHMYVDNAAMQLVRAPTQFDVILADNMFGDILSDIAATLTGSLGMLPSAALNADGKGMYEPVHGSAPDIAGQDLANPLAAILSLAMLFRHSLGMHTIASVVEGAVDEVLDLGLRTRDLMPNAADRKLRLVGTVAMGDAVLDALGRCFKKDSTHGRTP